MKKHILKIIAPLLFSIVASPLQASGFHDGVAAYEKGDIVGTLKAWRPAAEQGNPLAQYYLGGLYAHGEGVESNAAEAVAWYRKAAA